MANDIIYPGIDEIEYLYISMLNILMVQADKKNTYSVTYKNNRIKTGAFQTSKNQVVINPLIGTSRLRCRKGGCGAGWEIYVIMELAIM
ncbi:MAG: hypothetical protein LBM08_15840, partial [Dysgonamonadaceae bacterium]|nr:hypothetical protein [Dysgonamonadaceae bacterium]